jgi:hypothetical protein
MKRKSRRPRREEQPLRVWTFNEAQAAAPYITSVVRSIREHGLEALGWDRTLARLARQPGRPNRSALIAKQEAEKQLHEAQERFREAADELQALDIFSLDPLQGQALVPFIHQDELAWYIFDLFDSQPFRFWRFQSDPDETRRPLTPSQKGLTSSRKGS